MKTHNQKKNRSLCQGMSILEILIGATIITVGLLALVQTYNVYVKYALSHDKKVQTTYLLEEGLEAASLLRDQSWSTNISALSTATTSLYWNGTTWTISSTTNEYKGLFVRNINFDQVFRDANGRIGSTGSLDTSTRLVTVTVSYPQSGATTSEVISKYLVNIYNN